jgi:hypothetical protein
MAEHLIQDTTLTGIADKIRSLLGLSGKMSPAQMQTNLTTEQANITAALAALEEKGVTVPDGANSNALAGLIAAIEAGGGIKISAATFTPAENTNEVDISTLLNVDLSKFQDATSTNIQGAGFVGVFLLHNNGKTQKNRLLSATIVKPKQSNSVASKELAAARVYASATGTGSYSVNGTYPKIADGKMKIDSMVYPDSYPYFCAGQTYLVLCHLQGG